MPTAEANARKGLRYVDDHLASANFLQRSMNKVFPDHWSFMLGEIALYSFIILLLSGTYLALFFHASSQEVIYHGSYVPLRGVPMTEAFESTLNISFDVRGGLLMRQVHHWAALLFVAAIIVHLCRVFFTGAFRKPRTLNWHVGVGLLVLGILEGFAGYSLPDDLLSGTGLRIAYSVVEAIPVVGSYVAFFLFGGNFPGTTFIPRLFIIHVLLVPGILLALIAAHMMLLWHQKHTDFPGPGKTEHNVVGTAFYPTFVLKTQGFFFIVFGVVTALAAFVQINPIWLYGPYNTSQVSAGSQPDFYIGFLDGSLRLMPNLETSFLGHTISWNIFVPAVIIPGFMFTLLALYPALESWVTKDKAYHNLLERPRDNPTRTGLGVMSLTFYLILWIGGGNDIIANTFHWSIQAISWTLRILLIALPPVAYKITKRICLGLQHHDEMQVLHGVESGIIRRSPTGEYTEADIPLAPELRAVRAAQIGLEPAALTAGHGSHGDEHALAVPSIELTRYDGHRGYTDADLEAAEPSNSNGGRSVNGGPRLPRPASLPTRAREAIGSFFFQEKDTPIDVDDAPPPQTLSRP
jgi:ubiquinol-cytochrome c reductase cytochrome b subunit